MRIEILLIIIFLKILLTTIALLVASVYPRVRNKGAGIPGRRLTVREVTSRALKLNRRGTLIRLQGYLSEQISQNTYWFCDLTGRVQVEIDRKHLPQIPFDDQTKVILFGEVNFDFSKGVEIEVDQVQVV